MAISGTGISDYPSSKYAAAMRELAEGLVLGAGLLLLPFLTFQIIVNDAASLISIKPMIKALLVIIIGETVFVIASRLANEGLAAMNTLLLTPLVIRNKIDMAENIQYTILAIFGFFLCGAAWFFAGYVVNFAYSSPSPTS